MKELLIYDVIGAGLYSEGVTPEHVHDQLKSSAGESILVRINSPGGSVWDGLSIMNLLKDYRGQVNIQIDGLAASAATLVALAGDSVVMASGSRFMVHEPWSGTVGNSEEHKKAAEELDDVAVDMANLYSKRTGKSHDEMRSIMKEETWMSASKAVSLGFADSVATEIEARSCKVPSAFGYKNESADAEQRELDADSSSARKAKLSHKIRSRKLDLTLSQMS